ncbi:MAG: 2-oxoglutarate dehydrogenase E1 component [Bacteroidetes bacterium]|nr:2-oxoglutarate dehydrogenase E1 component [Bacteroidota bacterium]
MKDFSYITNSHPGYIENLYRSYLQDPASVDPDLVTFFQGFDFAVSYGAAAASPADAALSTAPASNLDKEWAVYQLIKGYRKKGHLIASTNPIRPRKDREARLSLSQAGLAEADLNTVFQAGKWIGLGPATLQDILSKLNQIYAGSIGAEFSYMRQPDRLQWIQEAVEKELLQPVPLEKKRRILEKLNQGVILEKFLHTKYVGQKRFSLEGGENTIVALDTLINTAAEQVHEVVIGMAHRGRLNVLANVMGKTYAQIFSEFEGTVQLDQTMGSGDVKYHMGYGSEIKTPNGNSIHVKLMPNPSHLEAVNPVVTGFSRAKSDLRHQPEYDKVLPVLIHGDASVAGQGVVYEVLQMSALKGYSVGGTIHLVINNQIGFTTDFDDARTSDYCTSLAATVLAPVLHVNGDDAEAVLKCLEIAVRYRQRFQSDIFIDLLCYRRHGHNEGDDPKFTQPQLYALIEKHPNPREVYVQKLMAGGDSAVQDLAKEMEKKFWSDLQERLDEVKQHPLPYQYQPPELEWKKMRRATAVDFDRSPDTAVSSQLLQTVFQSLMKWPAGFQPLRKVEKLLQDKIKLYETDKKIDWATAELLAYGTLITEGKSVRISGQDVARGTFSHRHAILRDEKTAESYSRLSQIPDTKGTFQIYNSLLSEYAVLGFEYGYALADPLSLVIWEAQFGDFANGAQTMIDQFIAAGEQKWNRMNGVTLLLPHGYEGQGPEHSSARLERFLQLAAELNIIVTNITTAANFFHALRRQLAWPFRKPLINFAPKANLRLPATYSPLEEFTQGGFREVIDDAAANPASIKKVLFCSGKIYYDLMERKVKEQRSDLALVRVEQLYPFPQKQIDALQKKYAKATWFWVQEEPLNMGAASFLQMNLKSFPFGVISRQASASTATGYQKVHQQEQSEIIQMAFSI